MAFCLSTSSIFILYINFDEYAKDNDEPIIGIFGCKLVIYHDHAPAH